ncbi:MAG: twin-arginine translocation signal domain-containing protein, partial [Firmicutes bacterium]|nr:twin-arginine translocation signal domain-containing protein [Bacillota bacterium]
MDRRSFLKYSAAGLAGLTLPVGFPLAAAGKPRNGKYNIVILGDS